MGDRKGQLTFEFIVSMLLFFAIVFYVLLLLGDSFSAFSSSSAEQALNSRAALASEVLLRSKGEWIGQVPLSPGLEVGWPEVNSTRMAYLQAFCSADYPRLKNMLDIGQEKVRLESDRHSFVRPNISCKFDGGTACHNSSAGIVTPNTDVGIAFSPAKFAQGMVAADIGDILEYPAGSNLDGLLLGGTVQFWVRFDVDSASMPDDEYTLFYMPVLGSGAPTDHPAVTITYIRDDVVIGRNAKLNFTLNGTSVFTDFVFQADKDHHIAFVFEPLINAYNIYIDGLLKGPDILNQYSQQGPIQPKDYVYVGSKNGVEPSKGVIDDFRIYGFVREGIDIQRDMGNQGGRLLECGPPVPKGVGVANTRRYAYINESVDGIYVPDIAILDVWVWR
ncbi:MAG: hypothetical protein HY367_02270 [Candidatus Aenigmarchaeota archaeon]|nr:hypothetical protein [Candidatus Aenigmarchaeota archaeon]